MATANLIGRVSLKKEITLHIVVCIKQTPDSAATIKVEGGKAVWGESALVVNPWDEYAIEEAIRIGEKFDGQVTAITVGSAQAKEVLKTCLAMGCDRGILISDEAFRGADARGTAVILSRAIEKLGDVSLGFFGKQAIDGDTGLVPVAVARVLNWTPLSHVFEISNLDPNHHQITVTRLLEEGKQICIGKLPAIISVVKDINEPRYPTFIGIRKASKAEYHTWTAADLELVPDQVGCAAASVSWRDIRARPGRAGEVEIIGGGSVDQIAASLADRLMAEKVI